MSEMPTPNEITGLVGDIRRRFWREWHPTIYQAANMLERLLPAAALANAAANRLPQAPAITCPNGATVQHCEEEGFCTIDQRNIKRCPCQDVPSIQPAEPAVPADHPADGSHSCATCAHEDVDGESYPCDACTEYADRWQAKPEPAPEWQPPDTVSACLAQLAYHHAEVRFTPEPPAVFRVAMTVQHRGEQWGSSVRWGFTEASESERQLLTGLQDACRWVRAQEQEVRDGDAS
jgi:hypothetical protein